MFHPKYLFYLCFCLLTACTTFPKPKDFISDPQIFHHKMDQNGEKIKTLTGELAVEIWQKNKKLHIRQLFATRAPLDLRMDTLSPFEQPIATLVSNQDEVKLYDLEQKKSFKARITKRILPNFYSLRFLHRL